MPQTVITLYTRNGCHLCEQAEKDILDLKRDYRFQLNMVDIDKNDELTELYGLIIPVVLVNGKEAVFGRINKIDISNRLQKNVKS